MGQAEGRPAVRLESQPAQRQNKCCFAPAICPEGAYHKMVPSAQSWRDNRNHFASVRQRKFHASSRT